MQGTASLWEVELMETYINSQVSSISPRTASLWEVELMETRKCRRSFRCTCRDRFPLGSGINGNRPR